MKIINEKLIYIDEPDYNRLHAARKQNINGFKVTSVQSLADLLSMYRDEYYETSRIIFLNSDNVIVGTLNVTSYLPDAATINKFRSKEFNKRNDSSKNKTALEEIKLKAQKLNAMYFYLVHNHPSNNTIPSKDDAITLYRMSNILSNLCKCKGGLILQAATYTYFYIDYDDGKQFSISKNVYNYSSHINTPETTTKSYILNGDDAVENFIHAYSDNITTDKSIIVFINTQLKLIATATIDNSDFNNKQIYDYIKNQCKKIGAAKIMLFTKSKSLFELVCYNTYNFFFNVWLFDKGNNIIDTRLDKMASPYSEKDIKSFNEELNSYMIKYWDGTIH